ncbi:MAG: N-acetyltransferase family protein [Raoultibacter sp.]
MNTAKKSDALCLRLATPADAEVLRAIYAPYIERPVTFEYEVPSVEEFRTRIAERCLLYPYLVLEENGHPVAYAYASRYKLRAAYQWDVELSVYVTDGCFGKGCGRTLYTALLSILEAQGVRNVFGIVGMPNEKSKQLHASFGFSKVGVQLCAGYKCGEWHDVLIYQKSIGSFDEAPMPIIPITELDPCVLAGIFDDSLGV